MSEGTRNWSRSFLLWRPHLYVFARALSVTFSFDALIATVQLLMSIWGHFNIFIDSLLYSKVLSGVAKCIDVTKLLWHFCVVQLLLLRSLRTPVPQVSFCVGLCWQGRFQHILFSNYKVHSPCPLQKHLEIEYLAARKFFRARMLNKREEWNDERRLLAG